MKKFLAKFQIGKQGITETLIESLNNALKNHSQVRASVLKSSGRDKIKMKEMILELDKKLPTKCRYRIIGFTIVLTKVSKAKPL